MATNETGPFRDGWSGRCKACGDVLDREDDDLCHDCEKARQAVLE